MDQIRAKEATAEEVWNAFVEDCFKEAHWEMTTEKLTIDGIVGRINPQGMPARRRDEAKDIFRTSLECIDRFGSVIAGATGAVFPASSQCFNAISIVTQGVQGYYQMFDNLTTIMDRMSGFLKQMQVYVDETAERAAASGSIKGAILDILRHFLSVLKKAYMLRNDMRTKVVASLKMMLLAHDGGIKGDLDKFELLVAQFVNVEIADIVRGLSQSARQLDSITKTLDSVKDDTDFIARSTSSIQKMAKIRQTFGIGDSSWSDFTRGQSARRVKGTGQWLLDHPTFKNWADVNVPGVNVWALSGESGSGKSFLLDHVLGYVRNKYEAQQEDDDLVYFATYTTKHQIVDRPKFIRLLKNCIYQLAQADPISAEHVYTKCTSSLDAASGERLWAECFEALSETHSATAFLLLDGIDEVADDCKELFLLLLRYVLDQDVERRTFRVKAILSGHPKGIDKIQKWVLSEAKSNHNLILMPEIDLDEWKKDPTDLLIKKHINQSDFDAFLQERLDAVLGPANSIQLYDTRKRITETLHRSATSWNFNSLQAHLERILDGCITTDDAAAALLDVHTVDSQSFSDVVARLNGTLRPAEIDEMNDLITWLIGHRSRANTMTLRLIVSARTVKSKGRLLGKLEDRLLKNYNSLLRLESAEDGDITIVPRSDQFFLYFKNDAIQPGVNGTEDQMSSQSTLGIQGPERDIAKRVLHALFDEDVYHNQFRFDEYFSRQNPSKRLQFDQHDADVDIALICLQAICDYTTDARIDSLLRYAASKIDSHIKSIKLDKLTEPTKRQFAEYLIRIFHDNACIDLIWASDLDSPWYFDWQWKIRYLCGIVMTWRRDDTIASVWRQDDRAISFKKALEPGALDTAPMHTITVRAAESWLGADITTRMGLAMSFQWIVEYSNQIEDESAGILSERPGEDNNSSTKTTKPKSRSKAKQVEVAVRWMASTLSKDVEDPEFQIDMGMAYYTQACPRKALISVMQGVTKQSEVGMELMPIEVRARAAITLNWVAGDQDDDIPKVVAVLLKPIMARGDELARKNDDFRKLYVGDLRSVYSSCCLKLEEYAAGEQAIRSILQVCLDFDDCDFAVTGTTRTLIRFLALQSKHDQIIQVLSLLGFSSKNGQERLTPLLRVTNSVAGEFHTALRVASNHDGVNIGYLTSIYTEAIRTCSREWTAEASKSVAGEISSELRYRTAAARENDRIVFRIQAYADEMRLRLYFSGFLDYVGSTELAARQATTILTVEPPEEVQWDGTCDIQIRFDKDNARKMLAYFMGKLSRQDGFGPESVERANTLLHCGNRSAAIRLYMLCGEESMAKKLARDVLQRSVHLFYKKDDYVGLDTFVHVFIAVNADDDAQQAWRLFWTLLSDDGIAGYLDLSASLQESLTAESTCSTCRRLCDPSYRCKDCIGLECVFCEDCFGKLPEKTREPSDNGLVQCTKQHHFILLSKSPVLGGQDLVPLNEWLRQVRMKWNIDKTRKLEAAARKIQSVYRIYASLK